MKNVVWTFFFVMILLVIYSRTDSVAGWDRGDAMVLAATTFLLEALTSAFFFSLMEIPGHVRQGTLDFIITKPVDTQFWISMRKFNFDQIGTLLAGIGMVIGGVILSHASTNPAQWLAYWVLVFASLMIFYAFNLMLMTLGVWLVRVENLWVLGECIVQVARYPMDIYSGALQRVFVYFVPLGFLATIPSRQLVKGLDLGMLALGAVWAVAFFFIARVFWLYATRHYSSASS